MKNTAFAIIVTLWPLLRKELVAYARDRRSQLLFAASFIVAAAAAFLFYAYGSASLLRRAGRSGGTGPTLFEFLAIVQMVFVVWLVPYLLIRRTTEERSNGSFLLLRAALNGARRIVLVKFAAALVFGALSGFVIAPFYGLVLLLGGVQVLEFASAACIVFSSAVLAAAAALYVARVAPSVRGAVFVAGAFGAVLMLGLPLVTVLATAMARQLFGAMVRSGSLPLLAAAVEVLLGLLDSLSPLTALLDGRAYFVASGDIWTFRRPIFTAISSVRLPAPFLTLMVTYSAAAAMFLRAAFRP